MVVGCLVTIFFVMFSKPQSSNLTIVLNEMSIKVDETVKLEYECSDEEAEITFFVQDEDIVGIEDGYVTAKKVGNTTIRLTAQKGDERATTSAIISVEERETDAITNLPQYLTLYLLDKNIGQAIEDGYNNIIEYTSYHDFTITSQGSSVKATKSKITAIKEGKTVLTFTSTNKQEIVEIEVKRIDPTVVNIPDKMELMEGEFAQLSLEITPKYYTGACEIEIKETGTKLEINETTLYAKTSGKTQIGIYLNSELVKEVEVDISSLQTCEIIPVCASKIDGDKIYTTAEIFVFKINNEYESEIEIKCENGELTQQMNRFVLKNFNETKIEITILQVNQKINYTIIKTQSL